MAILQLCSPTAPQPYRMIRAASSLGQEGLYGMQPDPASLCLSAFNPCAESPIIKACDAFKIDSVIGRLIPVHINRCQNAIAPIIDDNALQGQLMAKGSACEAIDEVQIFAIEQG